MSEMVMVTGCMVYGAGVGTNEMRGYGSNEASITLATLGDENNTYGHLWWRIPADVLCLLM